MKLGTPMVRCCLPIDQNARRSKLAGYDRIKCAALVFDTPEARQEHARDIHGTDASDFSAPVADVGYAERTCGRDRCPCGKRKSEQMVACADCMRTERQARHIVRLSADDSDYDPDERIAARRETRRDERDAQGLCRGCGRVPPRRLGVTHCEPCQTAKDSAKRKVVNG
jgi:hypothetical protein